METYITTAYVIADEVVRILKIQDDPQSIMSSAEVITFAIVTAKFSQETSKWQDTAVRR